MRTDRKEIALSGLSTSPNDLVCGDGNLAVALNVVHEDGALRMARDTAGKMLLKMHDEQHPEVRYTAIYRHNNAGYKHVVVRKEVTGGEDAVRYFYVDVTNGWPERLEDPQKPWMTDAAPEYFEQMTAHEVRNVVAVGNTLIFAGEGFICYYKWDSDTGYGYLGEKIPRHDCSLALETEIKVKEGHLTTGLKSVDGPHLNREWFTYVNNRREGIKEDGVIPLTDAVNGYISEYAKELNDEGWFVQPFIATLQYRLYDGSHVTILNPTLLVPTTSRPIFSVYEEDYESADDRIVCAVIMAASKLKVIYHEKADLDDWKDIVKAVEIYVSRPLYQYDQGEKIEKLAVPYDYIKGEWGIGNMKEKGSVRRHMLWMLNAGLEEWRVNEILRRSVADIPKMNTDLLTQAKECSLFYLLKDKNLSGINSGETIDNGYTINYANDALENDYYSLDAVNADLLTVYNSRLTMAGLTRIPTHDMALRNMVQWQDVNLMEDSRTRTYQVRITMKSDSGKAEVISRACEMPIDLCVPYLFWHDPSVLRMEIITQEHRRTLEAEAHEMLNGSVVVNGEDVLGMPYDQDAKIETPATIGSFVDKNSVRASEVGNPWVYKAANEERMAGEVIAMMPATHALSEGQFGEFPMYAFTTEGVWALTVNETGGWISKQPISRDVALSARAILQMDQSIIFATRRGLMHLAGSKIECISEVFDGPADVVVENYDTYMRGAMKQYAGIAMKATEAVTMRDYVSDAVMTYDYRHQQIVMSNKRYPYCYLFGMKDRLWTCAELRLESAVNSYPGAMANVIAGDGMQQYHLLTDLGDDGDGAEYGYSGKGFVLTRPMKMDLPDVLKVVTSVTANGTMRQDGVKMMLYASNDLGTWRVAATANGPRLANRLGTPMKYWRVGLALDMRRGEQLNSLTVTYETRGEMDVR